MDDTEKSRKREFVNKITFTKKQNIIITRAISMLSLCLVFGLVSLIVFYVFKFINVHSNVLLPPIVALIISEVIKPVYDRLRLFFWSIFGRS